MLQYLKTILFGPKIYAIFGSPDYYYNNNILESIGDHILSNLRGLKYTCLALWPVMLIVAVNNNFITTTSVSYVIRVIIICYALGYSSRFFGRIFNNEYNTFIQELIKSTKDKNMDIYEKYDFEIFLGPISFDNSHTNISTERKTFDHIGMNEIPDWGMFNIVRDTISYIFVHSFGKRLLYPGQLALINYFFHQTFLNARKDYFLTHKAKRLVLLTPEKDIIDSVFFDRRKIDDHNGKYLVICSEGNAGFYEVGIVNGILPLGFSIMGWNTPGFVESTGETYPHKIVAAIDTVFQSALNQGFKEEDIIVYGWSIGGYPSTWLGANYPKIKHLVLDATFDDVLPLAKLRMPDAIEGAVIYAVRRYLNLPVSAQLSQYKGEVTIIRRLRDEIIITNPFGSEREKTASNRANYLLKDLLMSRHSDVFKNRPELMHNVDVWLALDEVSRLSLHNESKEIEEIYNLCSKYFVDVDLGHNDPLTNNVFKLIIDSSK
uniref:AB hydrolase-1 domain-containing protein n=1 Tax=Parastrongyloides trichosuri TaxID=131310 RepID=A0A0N4ZLJ7_PARTI